MATGKIRNMEEFSVASGISRPTVSRYFHDPDQRQEIDAEEDRARSGRVRLPSEHVRDEPQSQESAYIGIIIVPHLVDPFFAEVGRQIELLLHDRLFHEWAIVLEARKGRVPLRRTPSTLLRSRSISGAIIAPLGEASDRHRIEHPMS